MTPDLYHRGQNDKYPLLRGDVGGIDWVSLTGKADDWREQAESFLRRVCEGQPSKGPGRHNYRERLTWPSGASIYQGHDQSAAMVELPGGACKRLGGTVIHRVVQALMMGGRCTRMDICRDQHVQRPGQDYIKLIGDILAACERGELCYARGYKRFEERDAADQCVYGEGVYLGSPKSQRFVRVYDKGLEQGGADRGAWVRFEAQLRGDAAHEAALAVCRADDWWKAACQHMLGVVDFRENVSERHLERRPVSPFWKDYCGDADRVRPRLEAQAATLERFLAFARRCVGGPLLAAAEEAGVPMSDFIAYVFQEVEVSESARKNPVVFELAAAVRASLDSKGHTGS